MISSEARPLPSNRHGHPSGDSVTGLTWPQSALLYGGRFVAVLVVGGLIATLLQLMGVNTAWAIVIGIAIGAATNALTSTSRYRSNNQGEDRDSSQEQTVTISHIIVAWPVDGLEDFGPSYVVETVEGERFFFAGEAVLEADNEGESLFDTLVFEVSKGGEILRLRGSGNPIPIDMLNSMDVHRLGIDPAIGFQIIQDAMT